MTKAKTAKRHAWESFADNTQSPPAEPAKRLRLPLRTIPEVLREMAVVYRLARAGRIPVADASRLVNALSLIVRGVEGNDLATRIDALEGNTKPAEPAKRPGNLMSISDAARHP